MRSRLQSAAHRISANRNEQPVSAFVALRKWCAQERRDWKQPGAPRIGWKRGELIECLQNHFKMTVALGAQVLGNGREVTGDFFAALVFAIKNAQRVGSHLTLAIGA